MLYTGFYQRYKSDKRRRLSKEDLHGSGLEICSLKNEVVIDGLHQTITAYGCLFGVQKIGHELRLEND